MLLLALLPTDEEGRTLALVGAAFFHHTLRHAESAERYRRGHELIVSAVADRLRRLGTQPGPRVGREARALVALVQGLASQLLPGHVTVEDAEAILRDRLGRGA